MSQPPETENANSSSQTAVKSTTPPRLTPSPDATDSEFKLSRKREREVSLEPVTTPNASNDTDPLVRERKDSRTPLKKNRRRLDPTQEEEDGAGASGSRSGSGSPPAVIMASPRQEMKIKVRQISQGVEDINWKGFHAPTSDEDVEINDRSVAPEVDAPACTSQEGKLNDGETVIAADDDESPPKSPDDSVLSHSVYDLRSTNLDITMQSSPVKTNLPLEAPSRLRASSESTEKGLKRKFLERGTSQGPAENGDDATHPTEALKRPRDEADKDDNPRETKRPSPPPSPPHRTPPSPRIPKVSGFMAYASSSSPFASVKGQNVFGPNKTVPSPPSFSKSNSPVPSTPLVELGSAFGSSSSSSTPAPTAAKRSGFESFASTSSPFTSFTRAKSPILGTTSKLGRAKSPPRRMNSASTSNPFASYAGSSHGFAIPAQKRARAASPDGSARSSSERSTPLITSSGIFGGFSNGSDNDAEEQEEEPTSFGERLRASKDDEDEGGSDDEGSKVQLTEQDVMTGEEEEETLHQVRGKLFSLHGSVWKERGTGLLKLNVKQDDGTGARLVMRKDAVYTLLLNITLFPGMRCSLAQDPRYLRFSAIEDGVATTYNLKVPNAKIAADLLEDINANIPT